MRDWFKKFKPDILIGLGLGSMFSATIAAFALAPMMKENAGQQKQLKIKDYQLSKKRVLGGCGLLALILNQLNLSTLTVPIKGKATSVSLSTRLSACALLCG